MKLNNNYSKKSFAAIVLAAGKGTRMNGYGKVPKVLLPLIGKPLLFWTLELVEHIGIQNVFVVTGNNSELVEDQINTKFHTVKCIKQEPQLGTAHAIKCVLPKLDSDIKHLLVLFGDDSALYKSKTITNLIDFYINSECPATLLTSEMKDITAIGGLDKDKDGNVVGVLSRSQLEEIQPLTHEVLCGVFVLDRIWIEEIIELIKPSDVSGEYPLPAIISIARTRNDKIKTFLLEDKREWNSVNTPDEFEEAENKKVSIIKEIQNGK
jgi:bifunctional UDP-N-acetylglucosamine pyrophosphorylase / glucosamine-1-phosphate N-acetyltransferase